MKIQLNKAFQSAYESDDRYRVLYGGAGSGKSHFVGQETILNMIGSGDYHYLIVRKTGRSIRDSVFRSLVTMISDYNLSQYFTINNTEMSIRCNTGSSIITSGLDDVEKLKSIAGINRIWVEEASEITAEDFDQLNLRMRGANTRVGYQMTLTFNPVSELHWLKKRFFDVGDNQAYTLKTTYLDNPFLDEQYIDTLKNMKETNENYYNIYALGEWGSLGKLVYSNWEKKDLLEDIPYYDNIMAGVDFGFSEDPSTLIVLHYDSKRGIIYIFDEYMKTQMHNDEFSRVIDSKIGNTLVTCDSAEPRSISDLRRYGINAVGAKKGPDSVKHGIDWINSKKIIVDERCVNTIAELGSYKWKTDKEGKATDKPEDENNHLLDALRYALEKEMKGVGRLNTISKGMLGI